MNDDVFVETFIFHWSTKNQFQKGLENNLTKVHDLKHENM